MRKTLYATAIAYGIATAALSVPIALAVLLLVALDNNGHWLTAATIAFSIISVGVILGLGLAWSGWRGLRHMPRLPIRLPPPGWLLLLFLLTLAAGELLRRTVLGPILFPPLHVLAAVLPPLIVVAGVAGFLSKAGVQLTLAGLTAQFSYGALVATVLAMILEGGALLGTGLVASVGLAILPGGQDALMRMSEQLANPALLENPQPLAGLLRSPLILLALASIVALLAPVIEEIVKSLGVWLVGVGRGHPRPADAFLSGVIAGVGFSTVEALFNGATLLPDAWTGPVLVRASTVVIHGLATGLMGLGWHELLAARRSRARRWWGFGAYALAGFGLHGLWNAAGSLVFLTGAGMLPGTGVEGLALHAGLLLIAVSLLGLLFGAAVAGLGWLSARLAAGNQPI